MLGPGHDRHVSPGRFETVRPGHRLPQRFTLTGTRAATEAEAVPSGMGRVREFSFAGNDLAAVDADEQIRTADLDLVFVKCVGRIHGVSEIGPMQFDAILVESENVLVQSVAEAEHDSGQAGRTHYLDRGATRGPVFRVRAPGSLDGKQIAIGRAAIDQAKYAVSHFGSQTRPRWADVSRQAGPRYGEVLLDPFRGLPERRRGTGSSHTHRHDCQNSQHYLHEQCLPCLTG